MATKIVLIDDDDVLNYCNKRVIEKVLGKGSVDFEIFEMVDDAISYLESLEASECPHYLLLDINMPGKNGWDFLNEYQEKALHEKLKTVKIYVTSTSLYEHDRVKSTENPLVQDFILKPIQEEDIPKYLQD